MGTVAVSTAGETVSVTYGTAAAPPWVGAYHGGPTTDSDFTAKVAKPYMASTYYQPTQASLNVPAETARIKSGIRPLITTTLKSGPITLVDVANLTTSGQQFLAAQVAAFKSLSEVDPAIEVYGTLDHEFEVKLNQGMITGVDCATYARALSNWMAAIKTGAPKVVRVWWYGGSDFAHIDIIGKALTVRPDAITYDPYLTDSHPASETFEGSVKPHLDQLRGASWYDGQPVFLSETACATSKGDDVCAAWLTNLPAKLAALGLAGAVYFNRDNPDYLITQGTYPKAVAALTASMKG